jgi:hypothetical protein
MVWMDTEKEEGEMEIVVDKVEAEYVCQAEKELRATEYGMQIFYCEPEEGDILGEGYEEKERLAESLMNSLQSSYQHDDVLIEKLDEDSNPHIFFILTHCM